MFSFEKLTRKNAMALVNLYLKELSDILFQDIITVGFTQPKPVSVHYVKRLFDGWGWEQDQIYWSSP